MSLTEIKKEIVALSPTEQEELRGFLLAERLRNDPEWLAAMDEEIDAVQSGQGLSREALVEMMRAAATPPAA